jgi:hypothetical protein
MVRVRASRKGLFCGQASFGRSASKTQWVYGFKVALVVDPDGVVSAFRLAPAAFDERPIGEALIAEDLHGAYLADKGFTGLEWERRWLQEYGALVAATPHDDSRRAWSKAERRWASGKRQIIEGVTGQLKDFFSLERHRAKTLGGLLRRLAAKVAAYTCAQTINYSLGRSLRHLADLLRVGVGARHATSPTGIQGKRRDALCRAAKWLKSSYRDCLETPNRLHYGVTRACGTGRMSTFAALGAAERRARRPAQRLSRQSLHALQ